MQNEDSSPVSELHVEQVKKRFEEFSQVQSEVQNNLLNMDPTIIGGWTDEEAQAVISHISSQVRGSIKDSVTTALQKYVLREREIQSWWDSEGGEISPERKKALLRAANKGEELELTDEELERVSISRVHSGIGVTVSPELLQRLVVSGIETNSGTTHDAKQIVPILEDYAEVGFVLDDSEMPESSGLPEGTKLVLVQDTTGADRAMRHEEYEILGMYIDEGYKNSSSVLKEVGAFDEDMSLALSDLAARVEEGSFVEGLACIGVSQEYMMRYPERVKTLQTILQGVQVFLSDDKLASEEQFTLRNKIAQEVRGSIINPQNLISLWSSRLPDLVTGVLGEKVSSEGIRFISERKGRFVFNKPTLVVGDIRRKNGVDYKIRNIPGKGVTLAAGAFGVTYLAEEVMTSPGLTTTLYVVKELQYPESEVVLSYFLDNERVKDLLAPILMEQDNPKAPDPMVLVRNLSQKLGYSGGVPNPALSEGDLSIGEIFARSLDRVSQRQLATTTTASGLPLYKGNLQFASFDAGTGQPIDEASKVRVLNLVTGVLQDMVLNPAINKKRTELSEYRQMFLDEAETLVELRGIKGVAGSLGITEGDMNPRSNRYNCLYLIQEYVHGKTLYEYAKIADGKRELDLQRILLFGKQLVYTLSEVHKKGVVHKDIKPKNIIMDSTDNDRPVLIDLGIAKSNTTAANIRQAAGNRGTRIFGTPGYAAQEQFGGSSATDARTDIHAVGMLLYELVAGDDLQATDAHGDLLIQFEVDPVTRETSVRVGGAKMTKEVYMRRKLDEVDSSNKRLVNAELARVILKATRDNPSERFQNAEEMLVELNSIRPIKDNITLDQEEANINKDYGPLPFTSRFTKNDPAKEEIITHLNRLEAIQDSDQSQFTDIINRLERLRKTYWVDQRVGSMIGPLVFQRMKSIVEKRMNLNLELDLTHIASLEANFLACLPSFASATLLDEERTVLYAYFHFEKRHPERADEILRRLRFFWNHLDAYRKRSLKKEEMGVFYDGEELLLANMSSFMLQSLRSGRPLQDATLTWIEDVTLKHVARNKGKKQIDLPRYLQDYLAIVDELARDPGRRDEIITRIERVEKIDWEDPDLQKLMLKFLQERKEALEQGRAIRTP